MDTGRPAVTGHLLARPFVKMLMLLAGAVLLASGASITFERLASGSVTVIDPDDSALSAVVTDGRLEQPLTRTRDGRFVGTPEMEGFIRVRCRNGRVVDREYVTGGLDTELRLEGRNRC